MELSETMLATEIKPLSRSVPPHGYVRHLDVMKRTVARKSPHAAIRTADAHRAHIRNAYHEAVNVLQGQVSIAELKRVIAGGADAIDAKMAELEAGFEQILQGKGITPPQISVTDAIANAVRAGAEAELGELAGRVVRKTMVGVELDFSYTSPESLNFLQNYNFDRVFELKNLTASQVPLDRKYRKISQVLLEAFGATGGEGLSVFDQARMMRSSIGLTPRQMLAVANFRNALTTSNFDLALDRKLRDHRFDRTLERLRDKGGALTNAQINSMSDRYFQRYVKYRAEMVARTESIRAANAGQQMVWEDATRKELLPKNTRKHWIVTNDDRLCDICRPIPGQNKDGVPITGSFDTALGARKHPPAHPACRCAVGLKRGKLPPKAPGEQLVSPSVAPPAVNMFARLLSDVEDVFTTDGVTIQANSKKFNELNKQWLNASDKSSRYNKPGTRTQLEAARKEMAAIDTELNNLHIANRALRDGVVGKIDDLLTKAAKADKGKVSTRVKKEVTGNVNKILYRNVPVTKQMRENIKIAAKYVEDMTGAQFRVDVNVVVERHTGSMRAFANNNEIFIGANEKLDVIVHEMFHTVSSKYKRVHKGTFGKWWNKRIKEAKARGETEEKLSKITGNHKYKDSEVAWEDKFYNPYIGKDYGKGYLPGEEASSMAGQLSYSNGMEALFSEDYGHYEALIRYLVRVRQAASRGVARP